MQNQPSDIYHLEKSARYRVCQPFMDFYKNEFRSGEVLTFVQYHFLPYHGGYTVVFEERNLYLQEEENADILNAFSSYLQQIER